MIGIILLLAVVGWLGWPYIQDRMALNRQDDRILEKVAQRRYILSQNPQSPLAHENLGDALREADKLEDAIACYEKAIELESNVIGVYGSGGGAGLVGTASVESKLRLTKMELGERREPEKHGQTLQTRQQVCTQCANLANPGDVNCPTCGSPLPVNTFLDTIRNPDMRQILIREGTEFATILGVITIALFLTSWLTLEVRLVVFFAACIVLANRFLKRIGPD